MKKFETIKKDNVVVVAGIQVVFTGLQGAKRYVVELPQAFTLETIKKVVEQKPFLKNYNSFHFRIVKKGSYCGDLAHPTIKNWEFTMDGAILDDRAHNKHSKEFDFKDLYNKAKSSEIIAAGYILLEETPFEIKEVTFDWMYFFRGIQINQDRAEIDHWLDYQLTSLKKETALEYTIQHNEDKLKCKYFAMELLKQYRFYYRECERRHHRIFSSNKKEVISTLFLTGNLVKKKKVKKDLIIGPCIDSEQYVEIEGKYYPFNEEDCMVEAEEKKIAREKKAG